MGENGETIEVTASVYKAAETFNGLVDGEGFMLADEMVGLFRRAGNEEMVKRWTAISDYLKAREFVGKDARTVIVPE